MYDLLGRVVANERSVYGRKVRSLQELFAAMDPDRTGFVSLHDFGRALKRLDIWLSPSELDRTVEQLNAGGHYYRAFDYQQCVPGCPSAEAVLHSCCRGCDAGTFAVNAAVPSGCTPLCLARTFSRHGFESNQKTEGMVAAPGFAPSLMRAARRSSVRLVGRRRNGERRR